MKHYLRFTAHAAVTLTAVTSAALLLGLPLIGSAEENDKLELSLQFYAAPFQVVKNEKIRLDWESEGADYCTASGTWSGKKEASGSVRVAAKKKTEIFTLQCFDEDGNKSQTITQKVTVVPNKKQLKRKKLSPPTVELSAPSHAAQRGSAIIAWSASKGTVACRATGPEEWEGLKSASGSDSFEVEVGREYSLSCWNENGQEGKSAIHTFQKKRNKYTAADVGLSAEYLPMYLDDASTSALAEGNAVYFIDFIRKEERDPSTLMDDEYYWGKRIALNIYTNLRIDDVGLLEEVFAAAGQVPPDVNPSTKRIYATKNVEERTNQDMWRFINWGSEDTRYGEIPTLSPDDFGHLAVGSTLEYLGLSDDFRKYYIPSAVAFWHNGGVAGPPLFAAVDVYNGAGELIRQVIMDAYTGEDKTGDGIFDGTRGLWDRTIMKEREETRRSIGDTPGVIRGEPISNPPTQTPVIPPTPTPTPEPKKEEQKTSTTCPAGFVWSPTLGQCYEDTTTKKDESRPTCGTGYSYSITLKTCLKD